MQTIDLRTPDLREVPVGTKVITSNGFMFVLMNREAGKESWRDEATGLIWHNLEDGKFNHNQAVEKFRDKLPTKEEFETVEEHGFREVLPNMKNQWFWSASVHPYYSYYAYGFIGYSGDVGSGNRYYDGGSVRCVAR